MKSYQIIAVLVALIAGLWILSGVFSNDEQSQSDQTQIAKEEQDKPLYEVRVRTIAPETYTDDVIITGRSQASRRVELKAETPGRIEEITKQEGEQVSENDLLARLEIQDRNARVREATERVNQRQIEYNAARKLTREGFNSKVRLAQSLADLENAKAILKDMQTASDNTNLTAPFEGTIASQNIETGDYVSLGDTTFTIVDLDPIEFIGFASEKRIGDITLNKTAYAELVKGQTIAGTISYIAPAADPSTRTFRIIMTAPNENGAVKEGLTAKMRIPATEKSAYKISPSILSLNTKGQIGVKIIDEDNVVRFVMVNILADKTDAMWVELTDTTNTNDITFITVGQEFVSENQTVKPVPSKGSGLL